MADKVGEVTLEAGQKLFTALGRRSASRWGTRQLLDSFENGLEALATDAKLEELSDEDLETYNTWAGCEELVIVTDDDPEAAAADESTEEEESAPAPKKKVVKKKPVKKKAAKTAPAATKKQPTKKKAKSAPAKKKADATDEGEEAAPATKKKVVKKKAVKAAPAKKKVAATDNGDDDNDVKGTPDSVPRGVRPGSSRPYCVGVVLAKHAKGDAIVPDEITPKMIAEADKMYAKISDRSNPRETAFAMRNAWHALRGYHGLENE